MVRYKTVQYLFDKGSALEFPKLVFNTSVQQICYFQGEDLTPPSDYFLHDVGTRVFVKNTKTGVNEVARVSCKLVVLWGFY